MEEIQDGEIGEEGNDRSKRVDTGLEREVAHEEQLCKKEKESLSSATIPLKSAEVKEGKIQINETKLESGATIYGAKTGQTYGPNVPAIQDEDVDTSMSFMQYFRMVVASSLDKSTESDQTQPEPSIPPRVD